MLLAGNERAIGRGMRNLCWICIHQTRTRTLNVALPGSRKRGGVVTTKRESLKNAGSRGERITKSTAARARVNREPPKTQCQTRGRLLESVMSGMGIGRDTGLFGTPLDDQRPSSPTAASNPKTPANNPALHNQKTLTNTMASGCSVERLVRRLVRGGIASNLAHDCCVPQR